jgi:hypothetical protein
MLRLRMNPRVIVLRPRNAMTPNRYSPADTLITDFCDTDSHWGPFLFVRPARSERFTAYRSMILAAFFGVPLGLLAGMFYGCLARILERPTLPFAAFPVLVTTFCFLVCEMVIAPPWNRRAACLNNR